MKATTKCPYFAEEKEDTDCYACTHCVLYHVSDKRNKISVWQTCDINCHEKDVLYEPEPVMPWE